MIEGIIEKNNIRPNSKSLGKLNVQMVILTQGTFLSSRYCWSVFLFMEAIAVWKQARSVIQNYDRIWIDNRKVNDLYFKIVNLAWRAKSVF
jgi:hypothetical protein